MGNDQGKEGFVIGAARVVGKTARALRVQIQESGDVVWVPRSVIHDDSEVYADVGQEGELVVEQWFAEKEGWVTE